MDTEVNEVKRKTVIRYTNGTQECEFRGYLTKGRWDTPVKGVATFEFEDGAYIIIPIHNISSVVYL